MKKPVQLYQILERVIYPGGQVVDYETGVLLASLIDAENFCVSKNVQTKGERLFVYRLVAGNVYDSVQEALTSTTKLGLGNYNPNSEPTDEPKR